jgi:hypothetical protein
MLSTHSSTATRMSQKMLISNAANFSWFMESWDVSCAFLQGLSFDEIEKMCHELGVPLPEVKREVHIALPSNVWFHLRAIGFVSQTLDVTLFVIELLKAMYGLNDAPLLWQLCLRYFFVKHTGALISVFDDNYYYWRYDGHLQGEATAHVDDGNYSGSQEHLDWLRQQLEGRFGKVSRQQLPMIHVGLQYEAIWIDTRAGFKIHQQDFARKITLVTIERLSNNDTKTTAEQTSTLRAKIGALLYLCITRVDLCADVCLLQTKVTIATIGDLRNCNAVIRKAHEYSNLGLVYLKIDGPKRALGIGDASFASSKSSYAIEGNLAGIAPDFAELREPARRDYCSKETLTTDFHVLVHSSRKAKRISHNTSHAESLANYAVCTHLEMIQLRQTEMHSQYQLTPDRMLYIADAMKLDMPADVQTDCNDLFELCTGIRGIPQDRTQRLIIMSLREKRCTGKVRNVIWTDTRDMMANCLTKHEAQPNQLYHFMKSGCIRYAIDGRRRFSRILDEYTERDLESLKHETLDDKSTVEHIGV